MSRPHQPSFMTGIALLLPITLSTMAVVLLAPILPQLLVEFGQLPNSEYWVPMILTVPALCVAIFSPIAGIAGDYFGRRKLLWPRSCSMRCSAWRRSSSKASARSSFRASASASPRH